MFFNFMFYINSKSDYNQQYQASITDPKKFWAEIASNFFWFKKPEKISDCDLSQAKISWFEDGKTNLAYNCLDRHLAQSGDKIAVIWEANDPAEKSQKITYNELHAQVCQFANLLVARGIKKGDRVCIYMPMIPESLVAMLACARIGAVHCVVFAGFSAKALSGRMQDCGAKMLVTADLLFRGEKKIELFEIAKEALVECVEIQDVIVFCREDGPRNKCGVTNLDTTGSGTDSGTGFVTPSPRSVQSSSENEHEDGVINPVLRKVITPVVWQDEIKNHPTTHQASANAAEDPLFILYTSGSTGKPKGILHTTAGYMVCTGYSFQNVFQFRENEIFFCSADIGWITGHSYLAYGPLLNGATILMFEGIPTHPTPARFWEVIAKHKVNIFYTAPTAIRALMQKGDEFVEGHDLSSLRVLGTVGEPINEEAWNWYFEKVGGKKCPITDTWWQTETGGIMIASLAGVADSKPAHAGFPLPGIAPILLDDEGNEIVEVGKVGNLCFSQAWPSMARGVWGDQEKFLTYFAKCHEAGPAAGRDLQSQSCAEYCYSAGDGAFRDASGLYRIIGRTDDVIKVSGHRLGTAEIENAINSHEAVSESAIIGVPHEIKGEVIYAFVSRKSSVVSRKSDEEIKSEILELIKKEIGAIAKPEKIFLVADLPKTRSGKIMRRILKKIIAGEKDLGDVSTLVNPDVVAQLGMVLL
jgi:acetyl-CoA synthetase